MVLLLLQKVVRFWNFLRTWLPRRLSLVGADTSNETGHFQTQTLVNQKKKFLVKDTQNLAFAELPSRLPWSFSFLLSHVPFLWGQTTFLGLLLFFFLMSPSCGDRPPSLVFFFSFSRPPFLGDRPALADSTASTYVPLYVACRKKNLCFLVLSDS
jgi:hypothetical protein